MNTQIHTAAQRNARIGRIIEVIEMQERHERCQRIEADTHGYTAGYDAGGVAWPESERIMVNPYDRQQQPWLWWWWREAWLRGRDKKREALMLLAQAKKEAAQ